MCICVTECACICVRIVVRVCLFILCASVRAQVCQGTLCTQSQIRACMFSRYWYAVYFHAFSSHSIEMVKS